MINNILSFSYLRRIRVQEFPEVINGMIRIVEAHDPDTLLISGPYNRLVTLQAQLPLLNKRVMAHPLTQVLDTQRSRRKQLIEAVFLQVRAGKRSGDTAVSAAVASFEPVVRSFFADYSRMNQKVIYQSVSDFLAKLKNDAPLSQNAQTLGVTPFVDELNLLQQSIESNVTTRRGDWYPDRSIDKQVVKTSVTEAFRQMLSAIELAAVEHPELAYTALINELNEFFEPYQALIRSRMTRSKTSALNTKTAGVSSTTSTAAS
ncbi:DUF6261 family protein [Microbacter margulisiae]|uniref:Uncharacterized protein n=1 Tax=Microbacter margulisiae TaxID=1350067 RepID=A0A7W5H2J3_9PORP|nr:DUF6261 family protein [Microbacter margulisiae]MBB3187805.1 hypothetical protein [Microbacter margulisiae]